MIISNEKPTSLLTAGLAFLIVLAIFLLTPVCGLAALPGFKDLPPANPVYQYANYLVQKGILKGYPDGTFRPGGLITRAEFAALLVRAGGLSGHKPRTPSFKDLKPDHWAYEAVEAAVYNGFVKGYPDGSFRPEAPVTRAETAALLLRLTSEPVPAIIPPCVLKDVKPSCWAWPQVVAALDAGLLTLAGKESFAPNAPATRGQVARGLAVMLNISPERASVPLTGTLVPVKGEVFLSEPNQESRKVTVETACGMGATISTGPNSRAELRFPDGSGLRIEQDTKLTINKARGLSTILRDGSPGAIVDLLEVSLPAGKIFGALANMRFVEESEQAGVQNKNVAFQPGSDANGKRFTLAPWAASGVVLAQSGPRTVSQKNLPWWKTAYAKRTRVKVDMPWGVACVRGCFWMNEVLHDRQTTNVVEGSVDVIAGGRGVTVEAGKSATITAEGAPPTAPAPMTADEKKDWIEVREWVEERASSIENNAPVITLPVPVAEQVSPTTPGVSSEITLPPPPVTAEEIMRSFEGVTSGGVTASSGGGGGVVYFNDANLESAVRSALDRPTGDITDADLLGLTCLTAGGLGIQNLNGLQYAANLQELDLCGNNISDLSPLASLTKLVYLDLGGNQISSLSPLSNLVQLQGLSLWDNKISDISYLKNLGKLQRLILDLNQISSVSDLASLTNLRELGLGGNQIGDISALCGLTQLQTLILWGNQVSSIPSGFVSLTNLQKLDLGGNLITDVSLGNLPGSLQELWLGGNNVSGISSLTSLAGLRVLVLDRNNIYNIPLNFGSSLPKLQWLDLSSNHIADISPLSGFNSLNFLDLGYNSVSDITYLSVLTSVYWLNLDTNLVGDLAALQGLTNLKALCLDGNNVADISPLVTNSNSGGLGQGDFVYLHDNPSLDLSLDPQATYLQQLKGSGVTVYYDTTVSACTYNLPRQFSGTQGDNNWYYYYGDSVSNLTQAAWNSIETTGGTVYSDWTDPGGLKITGRDLNNWHYGGPGGWFQPGEYSDVVFGWQAPVAGTVYISGMINTAWPEAAIASSPTDDGVWFSVYKGTSLLAGETRVFRGDPLNARVDNATLGVIETTVSVGDMVYFYARRGNWQDCDGMYYSFAVSYDSVADFTYPQSYCIFDSSTSTLNLSAPDEGSGVAVIEFAQYFPTSSPWIKYSLPIHAFPGAKYVFRAIDNAGNVEPYQRFEVPFSPPS